VRLIRKLYEADPLQCPKCNGPMRVIALIDDPHVVRRILDAGPPLDPKRRETATTGIRPQMSRIDSPIRKRSARRPHWVAAQTVKLSSDGK